MLRLPPTSTLFPYTTLFRSGMAFATIDPIRLLGRLSTITVLPKGTEMPDRKSTRLNSSHGYISYAVFCLKKKMSRPAPPRHLPPGLRCCLEAAKPSHVD